MQVAFNAPHRMHGVTGHFRWLFLTLGSTGHHQTKTGISFNNEILISMFRVERLRPGRRVRYPTQGHSCSVVAESGFELRPLDSSTFVHNLYIL